MSIRRVIARENKKRMAIRVAHRFILGAEPTMNQKIDMRFKSWRGKNPNNGNDVGYWTVKGWKQLGAEVVAKDPNKKLLKDFADRLFKKFEQAVNESEGKTPNKKKNRGLERELLKRENYGLPESIYNENKLTLEASKPTREEVEKLALDMSEAFKSREYNTNVVGRVVKGVASDFKVQATNFARPLLKVVEKKTKDEDLKRTISEVLESNKETKEAAVNHYASWGMTVGMPFILGAIGPEGSSINDIVNKVISTGLAEVGLDSPTLAMACTMAVGAIVGNMISKSLHKSSKENKKIEGDTAYAELSHDIYSGFKTPESVEEEYKKELQSILDNKELDPKKAKTLILALYTQFDQEVRPAIDKGMYLRNETEGSDAMGFMRRGAGDNVLEPDERKEMPIFLQIRRLKDHFEMEENLVKYIQENPDELRESIFELLNGKKEIDPMVIEALNKQAQEA
jgi:hypothetical protein